jgi:hypothetical protein
VTRAIQACGEDRDAVVAFCLAEWERDPPIIDKQATEALLFMHMCEQVAGEVLEEPRFANATTEEAVAETIKRMRRKRLTVIDGGRDD